MAEGKSRRTKIEVLCNLPRFPNWAKVTEVASDARCDERAVRAVLVKWDRAGKVHMRPSINGDLACISVKWWKELTGKASTYFDEQYPA